MSVLLFPWSYFGLAFYYWITSVLVFRLCVWVRVNGGVSRGLLTAEGDDAHGVKFVLRADVRAHADDEDVAEAGGGRHDPDKDPEHDVCQQVLKGRDAVGVGFAAAHVWSVATILELLEVAVKILIKKKIYERELVYLAAPDELMFY